MRLILWTLLCAGLDPGLAQNCTEQGMAGKLSENWQEGKTLQECNLYLMENDFSDITFRLYYKSENKREEVADIPALRLLCLARSPVFYAMFNGKLAQQLDDRIMDIHDEHADPQAFKQMIRFMYSDDVVLTADNVLAVLYLSQKYIVSNLTKRCLQFLEESLTPDTAPVVLDQSMLYGEKELTDKTLTVIEQQAPAVLASDEFINMSKEALGEILKLSLKVHKEVTVFEACMKWAKVQCQKLKKSPSGENLREVLGTNFYLIRFPTMSVSEITDIVAPENVLNSEEGFQVVRYISSESNKPENLPFSTQQRDPTPRSLLVPAPYSIMSDDLQDSIDFSTSLSCTISKPVCLKTIYIHAESLDTAIIPELTVTLSRNGRCLHQYTGQPSSVHGQLPVHYAVDIDNVRVERGVMELNIELTVSPTQPGYIPAYSINLSSPETSQLSDDYVTITFPPVDGKNLLLGIEYRIP